MILEMTFARLDASWAATSRADIRMAYMIWVSLINPCCVYYVKLNPARGTKIQGVCMFATHSVPSRLHWVGWVLGWGWAGAGPGCVLG